MRCLARINVNTPTLHFHLFQELWARLLVHLFRFNLSQSTLATNKNVHVQDNESDEIHASAITIDLTAIESMTVDSGDNGGWPWPWQPEVTRMMKGLC